MNNSVNNFGVEVNIKGGQILKGQIVDLGKGGWIVLLEDGRIVGVPQQFISQRSYVGKGGESYVT